MPWYQYRPTRQTDIFNRVVLHGFSRSRFHGTSVPFSRCFLAATQRHAELVVVVAEADSSSRKIEFSRFYSLLVTRRQTVWIVAADNACCRKSRWPRRGNHLRRRHQSRPVTSRGLRGLVEWPYGIIVRADDTVIPSLKRYTSCVRNTLSLVARSRSTFTFVRLLPVYEHRRGRFPPTLGERDLAPRQGTTENDSAISRKGP